MSALTRIFNNQIYNATIVASQKIAPGTITGSLFSSNVTVPGDLLIAGNLFVLGSSAYTTIASTNTYVNDPLVVLNNGFSGTNNRDIGLVFNRGTDQNQAIIWSETFDEFRLIATNETGTTYGNVTAAGLARLSVGSLTVPGQANIGSISSTGAISAASLNVTGNVLAQAGVFNALTVNGNESVTGFLNVTGNILGAAGTLSGLTVNGNESVTGFLNVTGNILAAVLTASQINTSGNVLATNGIFNALTVNGNESVTGFLNVTGNILGAAGTLSGLTVNGNETVTGFLNVGGNIIATTADVGGIEATGVIYANSTLISTSTTSGVLQVAGGVGVAGNLNIGTVGAVSGQFHTIRGNITQSTSGGAVYFNTAGNIMAAVGQFGSINSTGYINTSGNISTAQLNAGQINTTGNVLATAGTFNALTVNGNESVTGFLNVTGNVMAAVVTASQINTTGNVLATAGVFNGLTVNGNESVTGFLNVTGNVLADAGTVGILNVNNTLWANSSTATTTQGTGALIIPTGGISVAGAANIAGAATIGGAAQFNNTIAVGGISTFTNTTNSTEATGTSGALQIKGGASVAKDLWVGGNIYASNIFGVTQQTITVQDPLLYLTASNTFPYNYAIGMYSQFVGPDPVTGTGNVYQHTGVVRDQNDYTWKFFSNVRAEPTATVPFNADTIYDPVLAGNLRLTYTQAATSTTTGALQVAGGAGIAGTVVAGQINSTGNVLGQSGTFNAVIVNGNAGVTGFLNVTGNVMTAQLNAGQINTTGNVLATAGTFNGLTVNGNHNVTGNVLASTIGGSFLTASTAAVGNISAVTIGNAGATVTGTTGTFGAVNSGFVGNTGTIFTGASINLSGNVSATELNTGTIKATGFINTTANISGAVVNAGVINSTGLITTAGINSSANIIATGGVYNLLTINGNIATTGQFATTRAGNPGDAGGQIYLNGSTSNRIDWNTNGTGGPSLTTRSAGTKLVLYPALSGSTVDYAIGIDSATLWSSVAENDNSFNFKWFGGDIVVANLSGTGNFTTAGAIVVNSTNPSSSSATGALIVKGGVGVAGNLYVGAGIQNTPIGNTTASTGAFTTLSASAGIWANSTTASTSTTTGAIVVAGGVGLAGNIRAGGGAVINSNQTADPFQVRGVATTSLIYADTARGAVIVGGSNTAPQLGSTLKVNGTDSMLLPIGSSSQRPSATGNVDIAGMLRFNTTINNLEFYDGSIWQTSGGGIFTVITDRQFSGNVGGGYGNVDGTNTTFTIQGNSTTAGTIVSINGVIQFPILAYAVSGTTLTFTEPPAPDDVIDVRVLTTTTVVSGVTSDNGLQQVITSEDAVEIWSGVSSTTKQLQVNRVGDVEYLTGGKTTYTQSAVNIAANNTPYVISTWSQTAFVTAKYVISAKKGTTNFQSMEALVTTDQGGNAYVTTYAVVSNGIDMGGLTANVVGGNVQVYWTTTTNVTNANVKAMGTYIV
jgi:hypothetical protein